MYVFIVKLNHRIDQSEEDHMNKSFNLQFFAEEPVVEAPVDTPVESAEPTETAEPTEDGSQPTEEGEAKPDYSDLLNAINSKAVYKGEKMNLTDFEDVIARIQKSENYDQTFERMNDFKTQLEASQNSRQTKFMNKFLDDHGFETFEAYEDALEVDSLVNEGMSEERAQEHIKGQRSLKTDELAKKKINLDKSMEEFVKKFPDVKDIPQEVIDEFSKGNGKLEDIYSEFNKSNTIKELQDKLSKYENAESIDNKNVANAEISTGSTSGNGQIVAELTMEAINKMSPKQLMARWSEVKKVSGMK